jgi:diadenosine tetraphosphate (Ap4A) HIT family hydrolase
MRTDCPFCTIPPADVLTEGDAWLSFEPLHPVTEGHLLFAPVEHVTQADHPHVAAAFRAAAHFAMFWRQRYEHFNLILSVGEHATQTIEHAHVHLVPRREGDGLHLPWTGQVRG